MTEKVRHALRSGYVLGEYRIDDVLGQGGFGITYIGEDIALEKKVAIKEYLPLEFACREGTSQVMPVSGEDAEDYRWGLDQFLSEAKTLAKFHHPNIVQVLRFYEANGTAYIVMPFHEGESLSELLKRDKKKPIPEDDILDIVLPLLDGLETVHGAGILHRDIKPGNIFLAEDGEPILLDFGSARQEIKDASRSLTAIVSRGYAPIEQYSRRGHQGPWTDIYAMAAVMHHMMFGEEPPEAAERVMDDPMVPPTKRGAKKYSVHLLAAMDHALGIRQEDRPADVATWRREIFGEINPLTGADMPGADGPDTMLARGGGSGGRRSSGRRPSARQSQARQSQARKSAARRAAGGDDGDTARVGGALAAALGAIPGFFRNLNLPGLGAGPKADTMGAASGERRPRGPARRRTAGGGLLRYRWAFLAVLLALPAIAVVAWVIATDTASNDPRLAVIPLGPSGPLDAMPGELLPQPAELKKTVARKKAKPRQTASSPIKARFAGARMLSYAAVNGMQSETRVTFSPGGTVTGRRTSGNMSEGTQTTSDSGRWWTKGSQLCVKWNRWDGGAARCYAVSGNGSRGRASGGGSLSGAFKLYK